MRGRFSDDVSGAAVGPEKSSGNLPRTRFKIPKTRNHYSFYGESLKSTLPSLFCAQNACAAVLCCVPCGQTDMTNLIVAFRYFENASKKPTQLSSHGERIVQWSLVRVELLLGECVESQQEGSVLCLL